MEQYGRCVASSPATWQQDCDQLKLSISRCASSHPIVQKIRHDCAEPFTAFEQCLKQNQASVMNCTEHINQFLICADQGTWNTITFRNETSSPSCGVVPDTKQNVVRDFMLWLPEQLDSQLETF